MTDVMKSKNLRADEGLLRRAAIAASVHEPGAQRKGAAANF
jgi:hypothetical protein